MAEKTFSLRDVGNALLFVDHKIAAASPMTEGGFTGYTAIEGKPALIFRTAEGATNLRAKIDQGAVGPDVVKAVRDLNPLAIVGSHQKPGRTLGRLMTLETI